LRAIDGGKVKKGYLIYLSDEQHKALKVLAAQRSTSMKQLLVEQLNKLLTALPCTEEKAR
jgi:hypothetical protein